MKKRNEKQPVDDLFARKLADMSMPPNPDGFARLQARMGQGQPEIRVVFWRNPGIQRYTALAACLLLVSLFGWLYLSTDTPKPGQATMAVNKPNAPSAQKHSHGKPNAEPASGVAMTHHSERKIPTRTDTERIDSPPTERSSPAVVDPTNHTNRVAQLDPTPRSTKSLSQDVPDALPAKPSEQVAKADVNALLTEPTRENQLAATATAKPAPIAERVLVVTIAEPEALVAARQAVKAQPEEKTIVAAAEKPEKDDKPATLWQQMKRLKQGEVFARKDTGEDERGLLGRAYNGLKQSFDKEKSTKQ